MSDYSKLRYPSEYGDLPAIVVGSGLTALGTLRLLHRAGIRVYCVNPRPSFEANSRWYRPLPGFSPSATDSRSLLEILQQSPLTAGVLIPCSDPAVLQIAEAPASIAERFPASVASATAIRQLVDKGSFAELLDRLKIPRPFTLFVNRPSDIDGLPDAIFHKAFLKPCDSTAFQGRYGAKAFRLAGRDDARARLAQLEADGIRAILQEFVPGPASNHFLIDGFRDRGGAIRALFARRRLRIYPPEFGNSSLMVSVPISEVAPAAESLRSIVSDLNYRGIFSAEFKYDDRDGRFKIIEINARAWAFVEFTGRCGIDVCTMAYNDALGRPVQDAFQYSVGAKMVYPYMDFQAARAEYRAGRLSAWSWIQSWLRAQQPHFNWTDPNPAVRHFAEVLHGAIQRRLTPHIGTS